MTGRLPDQEKSGPAHPAHRLAYLESLAPVLWPGATAGFERTRGGRAESTLLERYVVLPHARSPRILVPAHQRRVASAAVRRSSEPASTKAVWRLHLVAFALRSGLAELLLNSRYVIRSTSGAPASSEGTVEGHLRTELGHVFFSLSIGPLRANRKPVLQLLDRHGTTVGFAKVGVDELTKRLVRQEHAALVRLAQRSHHFTVVQVPRVLSFTTWRGLDILVQSCLPVWDARVPAQPARLASAMREVATVVDVHRCPLQDSAYWAGLTARVGHLKDRTTRDLLAGVAGELLARAGATVLAFGAWHGDWAPWNMAFTRSALLVWDWERFADDVPVGFDAAHHSLQAAIASRATTPREAVEACLNGTPATLSALGVAPEHAHVVGLLYLMELATRYAADDQQGVGARLGVLEDWLLPVLSDKVLHV